MARAQLSAVPGKSAQLTLGPGVRMPLSAVTETFAILANRGRGKSSLAHVLVEELFAAHLPTVVLDVKGDWYGLRTSPDGTGPGLPFVILGGDHGDLPLESTAGEVVADVVVDERLSCVLDLSGMSKTRARSFATAFAERLYRRNRQVLHLVVDEADVLVPQRASAETARLLGAMEDIGKRGRSRGLGLTLVTQRPQEVAKSVLDLCETVFLLGMTGPRSIKAVEDWVSVNVDETTSAREVIASLPGLQVGEAWVWSPAFLRTLVRTQVRRIRTFDSHATPEPGAAAADPTGRAPVDLHALGARIAATVERGAAGDPAQLRRRIVALEQRLAVAQQAPAPVQVRVEVPVLTEQTLVELRAAQQDWQVASARLQLAWDQVSALLDELAPSGASTAAAPVAVPAASQQRDVDEAPGVRQQTPAQHRRLPAAGPLPTSGAATGTTVGPLPKAQRAVLAALAQHGPRTSTQVALLTGYSHKSGGYRNALSALRSGGLIDGRGTVEVTGAGLDALGPVDPLPVGRELVEWWKREQLGKAERAILDELVAAAPAAVSVQDLAAATGYSPTSGGFRNALSRLRSLELAHGRGELTVDPVLVDPPATSGRRRG